MLGLSEEAYLEKILKLRDGGPALWKNVSIDEQSCGVLDTLIMVLYQRMSKEVKRFRRRPLGVRSFVVCPSETRMVVFTCVRFAVINCGEFGENHPSSSHLSRTDVPVPPLKK